MVTISKAFYGKTIKKMDTHSANCWVFYFTDDTFAVVDTEAKGYGIYGPELLRVGSGKYDPTKS